MKKAEFIKKFSKVSDTSEDEFKAEFNSPELLWEALQMHIGSSLKIPDVKIMNDMKKAKIMSWIPIHKKQPEITKECIFHDPSIPFTAFGRWMGDGFIINGEIYKGTHWIDCSISPTKKEIEEVINYFKL